MKTVLLLVVAALLIGWNTNALLDAQAAQREMLSRMEQLCINNIALHNRVDSHGFGTIWNGVKELSLDVYESTKVILSKLENEDEVSE